jgi:hypothetical protein
MCVSVAILRILLYLLVSLVPTRIPCGFSLNKAVIWRRVSNDGGRLIGHSPAQRPVQAGAQKANSYQLSMIAPSNAKEKVLVACEVTGGAVLAYAAYRVIRMIPSVAFPPLWPTIPINVAVP